MANQANFSDKIQILINYRPDRPSKIDIDLTSNGKLTYNFGENPNDYLEIWIYNFNGSFAGHLNVKYGDKAIIPSILNQQGQGFFYVNIDMDDLMNRMGISPGQYSVVINFFRDEIGSENGYKTYISDISPDRKELKLSVLDRTNEITNDLYEFLTPSVPKRIANELLDITLSPTSQANSQEKITIDKIVSEIESLIPGINQSLQYAGLTIKYQQAIDLIKRRLLPLAKQKMEDDVNNRAIQQNDLKYYLNDSLTEILNSLNQTHEIDTRIIFE